MGDMLPPIFQFWHQFALVSPQPILPPLSPIVPGLFFFFASHFPPAAYREVNLLPGLGSSGLCKVI